MQKVITITTHTNVINQDSKFTEKEYPKLNEYLEGGYKVKSTVPIVTHSEKSDNRPIN